MDMVERIRKTHCRTGLKVGSISNFTGVAEPLASAAV